MNPELQARITNLRTRAAAGEELTMDEMRLVVEALREGRLAAHHASANAAKSKAKAAIPSASEINDLLDDL